MSGLSSCFGDNSNNNNNNKPSNETLLLVAFISLLLFASVQLVVAIKSEAMIGDCAAMAVDVSDLWFLI
jgi:hypothetical protein